METELLGRRLHGTVEPDIAAWIAALIESAAAATADDPTIARSTFLIELASDSSEVPLAILERESRDSPHGLRHIAVDDGEFWVLEQVAGGVQGVHGSFVASGARLVTVGSPYSAWGALRQGLHEVLAASGIVRVHAAVAQRGTATLALLGPSGRGKSTTLLRLAAAGWKPIAEDAAFVDVASLTIVSADEHDHVRLRPSFAQMGVPLPTAAVPITEADGRLQVAFEALGGRVPSARLTHFVHLVRLTAPAAEWGKLSRAEAVMALHEAVGVPTTRHVGRVLGTAFRDLVTRVDALSLDLGSPRAPLPAPPHV